MSVPEKEHTPGRQASWEPGCEQAEQQESEQEQMETAKESSCQTVKTAQHEKGAQTESVSSEGEHSQCEKGREFVSAEGEHSQCEKGRESASAEGEHSQCEKGGESVSAEGEHSQCEKGAQTESVRADGEHSKCEKWGETVSTEGEHSQCEKWGEIMSTEGEQTVSDKGRESVSTEGEHSRGESVSTEGQQTVRDKGRESVSTEGEHSGRESVSTEGQQTVSEKVAHPGGEQKKGSVSEQDENSEDAETDWKLKCEKAWKLKEDGIPTPDHLDWKAIYHKRPFGRNLLKSSNPEGLSTNEPPPPGPIDIPLPRMPLESYGDFSGWKVSTEEIPVDTSGIPPGVVVCYLPNYSWCILEQMIDLESEGLWAELMDSFQPEIFVMDWYEDSKLHKFVYELHVKLLGADQTTVIQEFSLTPEDSMSGDSVGWKHVSHIFKAYGTGVRYVHFMHKSKDLFVVGFHRTRMTNTTMFVKLRE